MNPSRGIQFSKAMHLDKTLDEKVFDVYLTDIIKILGAQKMMSTVFIASLSPQGLKKTTEKK